MLASLVFIVSASIVLCLIASRADNPQGGRRHLKSTHGHARLIECLAAAALAFAAATSAQADDIRVLSVSSLQNPMRALRPLFERQTGDRLLITFGNPGATVDRYAATTDTDVVFITAAVWPQIENAGVDLGSKVAIATTPIVVGTSGDYPNVTDAASFVTVLDKAPSIGWGDRASTAYVNILQKGLQDLGVWARVASKFKSYPSGEASAKATASGETALAISTAPEILSAPNVRILGKIPTSVLPYSSSVVGALAKKQHSQAAADFLTFMRSAEARKELTEKGLEPN